MSIRPPDVKASQQATGEERESFSRHPPRHWQFPAGKDAKKGEAEASPVVSPVVREFRTTESKPDQEIFNQPDAPR
jgi:hypothetical protein